ncbi:uncharacterized protein LOC113680992 [Pocillopora damicornis]|uniref:uncharacterized protein LOC113680992 n=1 Tax=Pocillopora damicornis TaxID=46731 RepID=UPI000F54DF6E|nr:uncharacterized protein LOC113680992 [Pocillopora damicornis]
MKFALVVPILLELFLATHACTEIRVTAEDKTVVVGRSMEFMIDLVSHIVVEPKDYPHSAKLPKTCSRSSSAMTWTNSYKIAYLDAWDSPVGADGQNDAGLSVGALLFPSFSKYQTVPKSKCGLAISNLEFTVWILGNFATIEEVRRAWKKDSFPLVWEQPLKGETFELHWSITDKSGDGIIIEYTEQGPSKFAHDPLVLGETTFPPTGQGSGLLGVPGDFTPPSRLVRSAAMVHFADTAKRSDEAVNLALHIMNTVDIPHGVAASHDHESMADYTSWIVVKDLTNKAMYFRNYEDLTVRVIHLDKVTPGKKLKIKVGTPIGGFVDVTGDLQDAQAHTEL